MSSIQEKVIIPPTISVVIPVKNGYPEIKECINGVLTQSILPQKILVIDSGSTDKTLDYLSEIPEVQIVHILSENFNHGETRNYGLNFIDTEFVYYTVQDARTDDPLLFEKLLIPFYNDFYLAGVSGKQVVEHSLEKNPIEWHRPQSEPTIRKYCFGSSKEFDDATPKFKNESCSWDNVSAMYRVKVLEKIRFQKVVFGEDMLWAKDAYRNGYSLAYQEAALVYHFHLENPEYTFKRCFTTAYFRFLHFNFKYDIPKLTLLDRMKIIRTIVRSVGFQPLMILHWYVYNIKQFKATFNAIDFFHKQLQEGVDVLTLSHNQLCSKAPTPLKRN